MHLLQVDYQRSYQRAVEIVSESSANAAVVASNRDIVAIFITFPILPFPFRISLYDIL